MKRKTITRKERSTRSSEKLLDFKKMGAIIHKNFLVIIRDQARIVPLMIFPIVMILIFGYTSGNTPKHIPTAIIPYDNSPVSLQLQENIIASEVFAVKYMVSTEQEARKLLDDGKVKVVIAIPPNLGKDVAEGRRIHVTVMVDDSDSALSAVSKQTMQYITASFGQQIATDKILRYQRSVTEAGETLREYAVSAPSTSPQIVPQLQMSLALLESAGSILEYNADLEERGLVYPIPLIITAGTSYGINATYVAESASFLAAKAQIASLQGGAIIVEDVTATLKKSESILDADAKAVIGRQQHESIQHNIVRPMRVIHQFAAEDPSVLLEPVRYEENPPYGTGKKAIDFLIPSIIALTIFQGAVMGMGRAIAGEKKEGSLTRVFLTPTSNVTILLGTLIFYVLFEIVRSTYIILTAMGFFNIKIEGSILAVFVIIILYSAVSTAIGMFLSTLVKTEQQYFGIAMLVSMPTIFLAGAFLPIQAMPHALQTIAGFLPVTYAANALRGVMIKGMALTTVLPDLLILLLFLSIALGGCFLMFKREID